MAQAQQHPRVRPIGAPADTEPAQFFQSLLAQYRRAVENADTYSTSYYRPGPGIVCVQSAGEVLSFGLLRALQHLAVPAAGEPDLTVFVWDDASSGTQMPPPPWNWNTVRLPRGEIFGFNTERFFTVYDENAAALEMFDRETQTAIFWTRDARTLPGYVQSAPLRTILHWHMLSRQMQLVHAGAIGTPDGGVLLAGKGGSGKSTTVLACLNSGLRYAADDYCLVAAQPHPFVYSLYCSAKLNADSLARLPHLRSAVVNAGSPVHEKAILILNARWDEKRIAGFPLVAIVLPRIGSTTDTTLSPTTAEDAIRALGLSTLAQLARANTASAHFIRDLARALPCYTLHVGSALEQIPQRLGELVTSRRSITG